MPSLSPPSPPFTLPDCGAPTVLHFCNDLSTIATAFAPPSAAPGSARRRRRHQHQRLTATKQPRWCKANLPSSTALVPPGSSSMSGGRRKSYCHHFPKPAAAIKSRGSTDAVRQQSVPTITIISIWDNPTTFTTPNSGCAEQPNHHVQRCSGANSHAGCLV